MELVQLTFGEIENVYAVSNVIKEFEKAVNESWEENPPWQRFQKKLIGDLAVLSVEGERAIGLHQFERLSGEKDIYSIRHPEATKNVRVLYTLGEGVVILLVAFLEKSEGDYRKAIKAAKNRIAWLNS